MKKMITILALVLSASAMADIDYACVGKMPSWNFKIAGDTATFSNDKTTKTEKIAKRISAVNSILDYAFYVSTASGSASILAGECSDGLSDDVYSHQILYKTGDTVLTGCCMRDK